MSSGFTLFFVHWHNFDKVYGTVKYKIEKEFYKIKFIWDIFQCVVSAYVVVDSAFNFMPCNVHDVLLLSQFKKAWYM